MEISADSKVHCSHSRAVMAHGGPRRGAAKKHQSKDKTEAIASKTVQVGSAKKRKEVLTAVDALDIDESPKRLRGKQYRSEDQQMEKILRDHFRGFCRASIDMMEIDGLTLRQRLLKDRLLWREGSVEMGKFYYMELRELYSRVSPEKTIAVQNDKDPEDRKLMACIEKCFHANKDYEQLNNYLETCTEINQKNKLYSWANRNGKMLEFETLDEKMENGRRLFTVAAVVDGEAIAEGKAFNKKDASQIAAQNAVEILNITA